MAIIQVEYRKAKSQYNLFLDKLESLECDRVSFNKKILKELTKTYFNDDIEIISYTDHDYLDEDGNNEYIFNIKILSKIFIKSKGKQSVDKDKIEQFKNHLRDKLIYNYKANYLLILFDSEYSEDELKYITNIL